MVTEWGMSEGGLGASGLCRKKAAGFLGSNHHKDYSEETAKEIDDEVRTIIREQYARARSLLEANRDKLEAIAEALLERETLDREEIEAVMGGGPLPPNRRIIVPSYAEKRRDQKDKKKGFIFQPRPREVPTRLRVVRGLRSRGFAGGPHASRQQRRARHPSPGGGRRRLCCWASSTSRRTRSAMAGCSGTAPAALAGGGHAPRRGRRHRRGGGGVHTPGGQDLGAGYEGRASAKTRKSAAPSRWWRGCRRRHRGQHRHHQGGGGSWAARAGARYLNDVSGGASQALLEVAAEEELALVLMHNRGRGEVAAHADRVR